MTETMFGFDSQVEQFDRVGPSGISYVKGELAATTHVNCLLYRDDDGVLIGVLYHYPQDVTPWEKAGNVNVLVDPAQQRRGIGSQLLREALRRWVIDLDAQDYTAAGRNFVKQITRTSGSDQDP